MAITNSTDTAAIIEKRVSEIITETLIQEAVMPMAVQDYSSQVGPGMDTLKIPLYVELEVQDVSESADMTPQSINVATADLILNQHKAIPFSVSDKASIESKANLVDVTVRNGAKSLAAQIDNYILGLAIAGAGTNNATTADPLADLAEAKKILDENNTPKAGRYVEASPGFIQSLLGNNNVINVDKYGSENPIQAGFVTRIYGFTLLESSSSALVNDGFVAHSAQALAWARQITPKFEKERKVLGQRDDYALTHKYGAIVTDVSGDRIVDYTA